MPQPHSHSQPHSHTQPHSHSHSQSPFPLTIAKYLPTPDSRRRYKRQCLKQKNILEQTSQIQIGCKIQKLYDFYTSKNYIQINLFIGNKTKQVITNYDIAFKGTSNLLVFLEEKQERLVRENTQAKQRVIIEWVGQENINSNSNSNSNQNDDNNQQYSHEIMLTFSFTSPLLTVKDTVIPLSVWSFCNFLPSQSISGLQQKQHQTSSYQHLLKRIKQSYQLIQQQQIEINQLLFKKGQLVKQLQKYFVDRLTKLQQQSSSCYYGLFTMKTLLQEHFVIIHVVEQQQQGQSIKMRIILAGNQYKYFQAIFNCLKLLLGK